MEIVVIFIFIKNSKICDKYYLKRRLDMDLKIKSSDVDGNFLIELFILENS